MDILLQSLQEFYNHERHVTKFLDIIKGNKISLRIIDWFVTNYSKKYNIFYDIYETEHGKHTLVSDNNIFMKQFNIYNAYKSQLKSYNKKKFDPFCRKIRISYEFTTNDNIETTVGQLNFFRWAIDNLVIDYIYKHYDLIEEDMNKYSTNIKKKSNQRKKRQELSKSASRGLLSNKRNIILDFN
jgi:hypothetical protein